MHDSFGVWVMVSSDNGNLRKITLPVLLLASAFAISACQSKTANLDSLDGPTTASTSPASFKKTTELGNRWQGDPKNLALGLAYAAELEKLGQTDQQLQVLATLSAQNPQNANIQAVYGKKLLAAGRSGDAIPVLKTVADNGTGDWRILSALGSAYDQQGEYSTARETYQKALALKPNQISVLNNMGMSHALEGNLKQAEETLRSAMALPEGKSLPRLRQNLALVVGGDAHIRPDFVSALQSGMILSLHDSRYVLFEPPHMSMPQRFEELLFNVQMSGYVPILTHPERFKWIEQNYEVFQNLARSGVWMQVTAGSLTGRFGKRSRYWAQKMLAEGLVSIVATDAHNVTSRPPLLAEARLVAEAEVGLDEARHLVVTRPLCVLDNAPAEAVPPILVPGLAKVEQGSFWRRIFRR